MDIKSGNHEPRDASGLARTFALTAAALTAAFLLGGAAVWALALRDSGIWVGLGTGITAAWAKVLHLLWWLRDSSRKALPGAGGMLVSIAVFGAAGILAALHSKTAVGACLSTFAIPYVSVIMVSLKGRPG